MPCGGKGCGTLLADEALLSFPMGRLVFMKSYKEKLLDPRWQKKRLGILNRDDFECQNCHDRKETLHVHHTGYLPETEPWEHPDDMLITLCAGCHKKEPTHLGLELLELHVTLKGLGFTSHSISSLSNLICDTRISKKDLIEFLEQKLQHNG